MSQLPLHQVPAHLPPLLRVAVEAAWAAGDFLARQYGRLKSDEEVSRLAQASEMTLVERIRKYHSYHSFYGRKLGLGEEEGDNEDLWLIDGLDGASNFLWQQPFFSVSLAFMHKGQFKCGVVFSPMKPETFLCSSQGFAHLDDSRLNVANADGLKDSLILSGSNGFDLQSAAALRQGGAEVRVLDCPSLGLCWLAAGRAAGFFGSNIHACSLAAGRLIAARAGARELLTAENFMPSNQEDEDQQAEVSIVAAPPRTIDLLRDALVEANTSRQ